MVNRQFHFTRDSQWQLGEHIERIDNPSVRRVFDRHDAEIGLMKMDRFKHGLDRRYRREIRAFAEAINRSEVAIAITRPEVRHANWLYQRPGSTQNFAIYRAERCFAERTLVLRQQLA